MNTLTIIVIGIIAIGMMVGYVKVFARRFLGLVITLFAIVHTIYLGPVLADDIIKHTKVDNAIEAEISKIVQSDINNKIARDISIKTGVAMESVSVKKINKLAKATYYIDPMQSARANIFRYAGFPTSINNMLVASAEKYDRTYIKESNFADYVAVFLVERAIKVASDLAIFIIIVAGFQIALAWLERNKESNVRLIGNIHKVGGAVLGGFTAMMIIWVMLAGLQVIPSNIKDKAVNQINDSVVLTMIQDNNLVMSFVENTDISRDNIGEIITDHLN